METSACIGIFEVATFLLLHRKRLDTLTNTKLQAQLAETPDQLHTTVELTLELNPASLEPSNQLLHQICSLQAVQRLASHFHTTTLQLEFQNCVNGIVAGCYIGTLDHNGDINITAASTGTLSKPYSFSGIYIKLQLPLFGLSGWTCAKNVARFFHLLCTANSKVQFLVIHHGIGHHRTVEYHCSDYITINTHGHTLMTTLHPHYHISPHSFAQRNKLHVVCGKKQPISGVRTRSGDLLTLELVVASSVVPMPTLARGKKIPADRLCKMLHLTIYGPGGVPLFPSCSERGVILSQIANWEDYGITISSPCLTTGSVEEVFDKTIMPSFSCELASTNDTSRSSVERNSVLYVFLFIDAVVESTNVIPTHPTSNQLWLLQTVKDNLDDIQLCHQKQFHSAHHSSLNKLLCNYNSFSKINSVLEEAIPSIAEAVTSIISHSNTESFKQSCHNIMEVESCSEVPEWLFQRLWRIAGHKLGAKHHDGHLTRAADEPDTPDISTVHTSSHATPSSPDDDNTLVAEEPSVRSHTRRSYHPISFSSHRYSSSTDNSQNVSQDQNVSQGQNDSFAELSEDFDLGWSDSEDDSATDDNLWGSSDKDDDTLLWDQDRHTTDIHTIPIAHNTSTNRTTSTTGNSISSSYCSGEVLGQNLIPTDEILAGDELSNETLVSQITTLNSSSETDVGSDEDVNMDSLVTITRVPPTVPLSTILSDYSSQSVVSHEVPDDCLHDITLLSRDAEQDSGNTCFDELGNLPSSPSTTDEVMLSSFEGTTPLCHTASSHNTIEQCNVGEVQGDCVEDFVDEDFDWN